MSHGLRKTTTVLGQRAVAGACPSLRAILTSAADSPGYGNCMVVVWGLRWNDVVDGRLGEERESPCTGTRCETSRFTRSISGRAFRNDSIEVSFGISCQNVHATQSGDSPLRFSKSTTAISCASGGWLALRAVAAAVKGKTGKELDKARLFSAQGCLRALERIPV